MENMHENGFPVYGANGKIGFYSEYTHQSPTLMVTCRGATCGTINISEPYSYISGNAMALDNLNTNRVDLNYLFYFLSWKGFDKVISGSAQPQITRSGLAKYKVILPPLAEQQRIAAIIDQADALRTKRRATLAKLDTLLQATFLDMFGDPVTNPMGWEVVQLAETFKIKPQIGSAKPAHEGGKQKIIRVGEIGTFEVDLDKCQVVTLEGLDLKKFTVLPNDFLLARAIGSEDHLGKSSVFQSVSFPVVYDSHIMRLRFDEKILHPYVFFQWMKSKGGRARFMQKAGRTAVQFNINTKQISVIDFPLPPMAEQMNFVVFFKKVLLWKERQSQSARKLNNLFHALQQRAFQGEL